MLDLAIAVSDPSVAADQYRFVETHAWWLGTFGPHQHLTEHRLRHWVPAHPGREWLLHRELTGAQTWLTGSAAQAAQDGFELASVAPTGLFRTPPEPRGSAEPRGSWQDPTPTFFARLPTDADELLARLREDNPGSWFTPFSAAVTALRTGLVPAALRAALYRALTGLPGVEIVAATTNLDGAACLALVHDAGRTRTELLIDPIDGQFAGERDTVRDGSRCGLPGGTMISTTAVRTAVVDAAAVESTARRIA